MSEKTPKTPKPKIAGVLARLKEEGGFWIPNEFIDVHAREMGPRAVFVYCILARSITTKFYPSVKELSFLTRISKTMIVEILLDLKKRKLLTIYDLRKMRGFPNATIHLIEKVADEDLPELIDNLIKSSAEETPSSEVDEDEPSVEL